MPAKKTSKIRGRKKLPRKGSANTEKLELSVLSERSASFALGSKRGEQIGNNGGEGGKSHNYPRLEGWGCQRIAVGKKGKVGFLRPLLGEEKRVLNSELARGGRDVFK